VNLFDLLVTEAMKRQGRLASLRSVVEKELLHHDILREMSSAGMLNGLTFIGGTCLRACYGSNRLSEDLDFTGGVDFRCETLSDLKGVLEKRLRSKYNLHIEVSEPVRETGNVDTWKLKVVTHPDQRNLPAQRIHIDICSVPSYDRRPMLLRNHYGVEMGTSGLIVQAESREEILADKVVAFALRPNRIKNRDLWDIGWLKQQNVTLPPEWVVKKIADQHRDVEEFLESVEERTRQLREDPAIRKEFIHEMRRFLPPQIMAETVEKEDFWRYLADTVHAECVLAVQAVTNPGRGNAFAM